MLVENKENVNLSMYITPVTHSPIYAFYTFEAYNSSEQYARIKSVLTENTAFPSQCLRLLFFSDMLLNKSVDHPQTCSPI
jgi:hypothetical protein